MTSPIREKTPCCLDIFKRKPVEKPEEKKVVRVAKSSLKKYPNIEDGKEKK